VSGGTPSSPTIWSSVVRRRYSASVRPFNHIHAAVLATESSLNKHYWTLFSLAYGLQAQSVFEFGAGGSSAVLLAALELTGGRLTSCDTEPLESLVSWIPHLRECSHSTRWTFRNMPSS
jgi:hypothetical protein